MKRDAGGAGLSAGEPGVTVMWRGVQRWFNWVARWRLLGSANRRGMKGRISPAGEGEFQIA